MNLNEMPDLCLIAILDRLPLRDLIYCSVVCHRWYNICESLCNQKSSLQLFGDCRVNHFKLNMTSFLNTSHCSDQVTILFAEHQNDYALLENFLCVRSTNRQHILTRFPNIKQITLINYNMESSGNRIVLKTLNLWREQLTELRIIGIYNWRGLVKSVNRLPRLKRLSIDADIGQVSQLAVMSQLEHLICTYWYPSSDLAAMLNKNLPVNIKSFGMGIDFKRELMKRGISALPERYSTAWTSLYALNVDSYSLTLLCDKLHALQHLQIEFYPQLSSCSAEYILTQLARLKSLQVLKLLFYYGLTTSNTNPFSSITDANIGQMPQLESVKVVEVSAVISVHQLVLLQGLFRNASRVTLTIRLIYMDYFKAKLCTRCDNCEYAQRAIDALKANPTNRCTNSLLLDCKQGKIVKYKKKKDLISNL